MQLMLALTNFKGKRCMNIGFKTCQDMLDIKPVNLIQKKKTFSSRNRNVEKVVIHNMYDTFESIKKVGFQQN